MNWKFGLLGYVQKQGLAALFDLLILSWKAVAARRR